MVQKPPISGIEVLTSDHNVGDFSCGTPDFDDWLRNHALQSQRSDGVRVYVLHRDGRVVAYYALTFGSVAKSAAPSRIGRGIAEYGIPVIILARLAVDEDEKHHGLGTALLRDALLRAEQAAEIGGLRALLIHVYDDAVKPFYEQFDIFEESPTDRLHLFLLMKDLRKELGQ